jgi:hypothetical protein
MRRPVTSSERLRMGLATVPGTFELQFLLARSRYRARRDLTHHNRAWMRMDANTESRVELKLQPHEATARWHLAGG